MLRSRTKARRCQTRRTNRTHRRGLCATLLGLARGAGSTASARPILGVVAGVASVASRGGGLGRGAGACAGEVGQSGLCERNEEKRVRFTVDAADDGGLRARRRRGRWRTGGEGAGRWSARRQRACGCVQGAAALLEPVYCEGLFHAPTLCGASEGWRVREERVGMWGRAASLRESTGANQLGRVRRTSA